MPVGRRISLVLVFLSGGSVAACSSSSMPPPGETGAAPVAAPTASSPPDSSGTSGAPGGTSTPPPTNPSWGLQACPAAGANVGFALGDSVGDLGVKDCETGAPATIDELCGASATWIFAAHTHCPTCQATAGFTDEVAAAVASKNVAVVQVVYDDNGTSCDKWRSVYKLAGLANVRVYADPGGAVFNKLKSSNYTAASAFLDRNRVITHLEHNLGKSDVLTEIDKALARP